VEVSLSPFFSAYFGGLFIVLGIVIVWRVRATSQLIAARRVPTLYCFAAFVSVCGALCVVLDEEWFSFSRWWKVPLYSAVGTSTRVSHLRSPPSTCSIGCAAQAPPRRRLSSTRPSRCT
jgi:hypothetical protein